LRSYPPLTPGEVIQILLYRGFEHTGTRGSHAQYEKGSLKVTVDKGFDVFDPFLLQSMIRQSGLSKKEFYCSTKATALKINKRFKPDKNRTKP